MTIQATIDTTLNDLRGEASVLEQRLSLVHAGIQALERLAALYTTPAPAEAVVANAPVSAAIQPRASLVPVAESAVSYVADASVGASNSAPMVSAPMVSAPTLPVVLARAEASEDLVAQLQADVNNWSPVLKREKLEDVYLMLLLRKDRFSKNLPPTMDLKNAQVVRTLTNHLRHEAVPGYFQLCARLKQHEHLAYLYRRARDKATGSIFRAYPELFDAASEVAPSEAEGFSPVPAGYQQESMPPSGAHHFAALANLRSGTAEEAVAA